MIFSAQQLFSDDQAITASADSTNVIDLGVPGTPYGGAAAFTRDIGKGTKIPVLVQVTVAFNNLTTLQVIISTGATTALGTAIASQTIALADLVAGKQISIDVLPNDITERYLGIEYVVVGTAPTLGQVTAGITMGNQTNVTGV
tara:strand:- start:37943 stop:38374 length:432 start_codon:yes stop_codon:yes gene_type:complete